MTVDLGDSCHTATDYCRESARACCRTDRLLGASHGPDRESARALLPYRPPARRLSRTRPGVSSGLLPYRPPARRLSRARPGGSSCTAAVQTACSAPLTDPTGRQFVHCCRTDRLLGASHGPDLEAARALLPYRILQTACSAPLTRPTGRQLRSRELESATTM